MLSEEQYQTLLSSSNNANNNNNNNNSSSNNTKILPAPQDNQKDNTTNNDSIINNNDITVYNKKDDEQEILTSNSDGYFEKIIKFKKKIKLISSGKCHVVIVTTNGDLYMYGINVLGQLGIGKKIPQLQKFTKIKKFKNIKLINAGLEHTIIVNDFNEVFVTGRNFGQLGLESFTTQYKFTKLFYLNNKLNFKLLTGNEVFTILITKNNEFYCCGEHLEHQLGMNENEYRDLPLFVKNENFPKIEVKDVKCGYFHTLILDIYGDVYASGKNNFGANIGSNIYGGNFTANSSSGSCLRRDSNNNNENFSGNFSEEEKGNNFKVFTKLNLLFIVKEIACNRHSSLFLSVNNELFVTGNNSSGQLGLNLENNMQILNLVKINYISNKIKHIFSSPHNYFNFILTIDNELYASGENHFGQLFILKENCKTNIYNTKYLDIFTRIPFKINKKYINVIPSENYSIIVSTNYKLNGRYKNLEIKLMKNNLKKQLNEKKIFSDISFNFLLINDNNLAPSLKLPKKRIKMF